MHWYKKGYSRNDQSPGTGAGTFVSPFRKKKAQYKNTDMVYKMMVPTNAGPNPYLTCSQPLIAGLNAHPKFQAMLVRLATMARDEASTCSMTKVW